MTTSPTARASPRWSVAPGLEHHRRPFRHFFHYLGGDRDMREQYRGHPHLEACAEFCEKYD